MAKKNNDLLKVADKVQAKFEREALKAKLKSGGVPEDETLIGGTRKVRPQEIENPIEVTPHKRNGVAMHPSQLADNPIYQANHRILENFKFESHGMTAMHRTIFELHVEGHSPSEIARILPCLPLAWNMSEQGIGQCIDRVKTLYGAQTDREAAQLGEHLDEQFEVVLTLAASRLREMLGLPPGTPLNYNRKKIYRTLIRMKKQSIDTSKQVDAIIYELWNQMDPRPSTWLMEGFLISQKTKLKRSR